MLLWADRDTPLEFSGTVVRRGGRSAAFYPRSDPFRAVPWVFTVLLAAMGTFWLPAGTPWPALRAFVLELAGIVLTVHIVSQGNWTWPRVRAALRAAPNVAIAGFLLWVGLSAAFSELPAFSYYEAMRHLGGGLIYFAVVYGVTRRNLSPFVMGLGMAVSLAVAVALLSLQGVPSERLAGAFRNEQLLAGILCVTLPVVLMASQADEVANRRLFAFAAVAVALVGILGTRNRSAWIGSLISCTLMLILYVRYEHRERKTLRPRLLLIPLLALVAGFGLLTVTSRITDSTLQRAGTLVAIREQVGYQWRAGMWTKALRMAADRPVRGWGVGTFPIQQALYHHPEVRTREQWVIATEGASLSENAHNAYLQILAELGIPGLILYLAIFATFLATAAQALSSPGGRFRKLILIGAISGVVGQMVSALGSPAWEYAECSLFFWTVLGLGMAAAGVGTRGGSEPQVTPVRQVREEHFPTPGHPRRRVQTAQPAASSELLPHGWL